MTSNGRPVTQISPATKHSTVTVTCVWDEGCPTRIAQLKKDGTELIFDQIRPNYDMRQRSLRQINYVIQHVQSSDRGQITCEAAGARHKISVMVHVRCELYLSLHISSLSLFLPLSHIYLSICIMKV